MTIRISARRLVQPGTFNSLLFPPTSTLVLPFHSRPISFFGKGKKKDENIVANPILEEYLRKEEARKAKAEKQGPQRPELEQGTMAPESIFDEVLPEKLKPEKVPMRDLPGQKKKADTGLKANAAKQQQAEPEEELTFTERDLQLMRMKLDPKPLTRQRWERDAVIRSLRRRGRLTVPQQLMRTERQSVYRSPNFATSVKKLTKLMRQISGKTIEEALVQMRFSKKKVAVDVVRGLEIARNEAIAGRGMGVGVTSDEEYSQEDGAKRGMEIELRNGRKKIVADPTEIYIDQAWVGKGPVQHSPEFRARGRVNMLTHRSTSFSVLLKEEKTRMRISDEIQKKRENRKVKVPLPDRVIPSQRQYCLW